MMIGAQEYPIFQYYQFQKLELKDHFDDVLSAVRAAGLDAWETSLPEESAVPVWKERLDRFGLKMPTSYLGGVMHEGDEQKLVEDSVRLAAASLPLGVRVVLCNPNPIAWGSPHNKTDEQLRFQSRVLEKIGTGLKAQNQVLAYHTHDPEMRCGAREFYHMMQNVDPAVMKFCLDVHWIYRGCENSNLALENVIKMYGERIAAVHLRQSKNGVWTEHLQDGDVDYKPVVACLKKIGFNGPYVVEAAFEDGTPRTLSIEDSLRKSREWISATFAG